MKDFFKNISIYGILPVLGKFMGFFLVPIYARVFSSEVFGQVELIVSLISFMMFLVNLEFYTAIGRFFYDKGELYKQKVLISTGLWLTVFAAVLVAILCFLFEDYILKFYLGGADLRYELRIGFIWLFISAFSSYLSVIPRYDKKPKLYVLVNSISLFFRLLMTILFVVVLNVGIVGILYGHILGALLSFILNFLISRKFLGFCFEAEDAKLILRFAIPLIPGLIVVGLWNPIYRSLMLEYFSFAVVGLFSFATRITSITNMFTGALRNAWRPMLFENIKNITFIDDVKKISGKISFVLLSIGITLSLFSPEVCLIVGTEEFSKASIFIPFLVLVGYCDINIQLRGFGPYITNKTYLTSIYSFVAFLCAICLFVLLKDTWGMIGLGCVIFVYYLLHYFLQYIYTSKHLKAIMVDSKEYFLLLLLFSTLIFISLNIDLIFRIIYFIIIAFYLFYLEYKYYKIILK